MEEKDPKRQINLEGTHSNIIFGTSSDDIERGLHNNQFIYDTSVTEDGDKDQIVNEEEQNEIVNPSEENFNEEPAQQTSTNDKKTINEDAKLINQPEENLMDPDQKDIDKQEKI